MDIIVFKNNMPYILNIFNSRQSIIIQNKNPIFIIIVYIFNYFYNKKPNLF